MFDQAQIREFEDFNVIDKNSYGFIGQADLQEMFASMGKEVNDEILDSMINEAPGSINFAMFLTFFGEKLTGTDPISPANFFAKLIYSHKLNVTTREEPFPYGCTCDSSLATFRMIFVASGMPFREKFATDTTSGEQENDAPLLHFKRNVQLSMEREVERQNGFS